MTKFHLIFILDRSGSMSGLEKDTIGGYNGFLKNYVDYPNTLVSTVLFDHERILLKDGVPVKHARLEEKDYQPRGSTALLDAIGHTITYIKAKQALQASKDQAIFIITTDGFENASTSYGYKEIHQLIKGAQKDNHEFVFLGANIDVGLEAQKLGIKGEFQASYTSTKEGTKKMYQTMDTMVKSMMEEK